MSKRVFLIVLDSFGIGELPDAHLFGDKGTNTLRSITKSKNFSVPNLTKLGFFNIDSDDELIKSRRIQNPTASYGRLAELSKGKDTTIGHWEISGIISDKPLPTYPKGFPKELLEEFSEKTGRGVLCNLPYSGTQVIKEYGEEHMRTGNLIVYTSADSVFQIAAHEDIVPVETLYEYCRIAREILCGEHGVGRVIARPFVGNSADTFVRTSNRHDFSLAPPKETMLDCISDNGLDCIAVGKIFDIFAGRGITEHIYTKNNTDSVNRTVEYLEKDFNGLCFVNLVDFDMLYGHRNDIDGYAAAVSEFDRRLPEIIDRLKEDDLLIITADHGCDPGYKLSTDHSREYVPLIVYSRKNNSVNLGTTQGLCCIGKTVCEFLNTENKLDGESFLKKII